MRWGLFFYVLGWNAKAYHFLVIFWTLAVGFGCAKELKQADFYKKNDQSSSVTPTGQPQASDAPVVQVPAPAPAPAPAPTPAFAKACDVNKLTALKASIVSLETGDFTKLKITWVRFNEDFPDIHDAQPEEQQD